MHGGAARALAGVGGVLPRARRCQDSHRGGGRGAREEHLERLDTASSTAQRAPSEAATAAPASGSTGESGAVDWARIHPGPGMVTTNHDR